MADCVLAVLQSFVELGILFHSLLVVGRIRSLMAEVLKSHFHAGCSQLLHAPQPLPFASLQALSQQGQQNSCL
jgi:hypothetical protein